MNADLIAFAVKTEQAHIAIVESDHNKSRMHFMRVRDELHSMIESVHISSRKIKLVNGTLLHFCNAARYELLRGLRLDRIETVPAALRLMPEGFLETRLKPGVAPNEGIAISEVRHG